MVKPYAQRWVRIVSVSMAMIAVAMVAAIFFFGRCDSLRRREQVAARIQYLCKELREHPDDREALLELRQRGTSTYRFERCYALRAFSEMQPFADNFIDTLLDGLNSDDKFVRDCAAQSLSELGPNAAAAKSSLASFLFEHPNERAAMFSAEALGAIGDDSPDVLHALREGAMTSNYEWTREACTSAYLALTGRPLDQDAR